MKRWIQGSKGKLIGVALICVIAAGTVAAPEHAVEAAQTLGTAVGTLVGLVVSAVVTVTLSLTVGPQIGIPAGLAVCIALCPSPPSNDGGSQPPPTPSCELHVSPGTLESPQRVTVAWEVEDAEGFELQMNEELLGTSDPDGGSLDYDGSMEVLVEKTSDLEIIAVNNGQWCHDDAIVWLPPQGCEATFSATEEANGDYELSWSITNRPQSVQISESGTVVYSGNDASHSITVSDATDYTITATNPAGSCTATITAGVPDAPSVTLEGRNVTENTDWTAGNFSIVTGQIVELRWDSPAADSCAKSFVAGSDTASTGVVPDVAPDADGETYTIECENENPDSGQDSITITANDQAPVLSAEPDTGLRVSDSFLLKWDLNGNEPRLCKFTAGASAPTQATVSNQTEATLTAQGATTYTLQCAGGSDSLDIEVQPQIFES